MLKAHSSDSRARVFRCSDTRWTPATDELRELPHALVCPAADSIVAALRDGTIIASSDRGATWRQIASVDGVRSAV